MKHKCIYHKNKNGMGGVAISIATHEEIIINKSAENFALNKDEVEVVVANDMAEITVITKHNTQYLVGTIKPYKDKYLLEVIDTKFGNYLVYVDVALEGVMNETYSCKIVSYPNHITPFFKVIVINSVDETANFIKQILLDANITRDFSSQILEYVAKISDEISNQEIDNRTDLRHLPFITIDGKDAKDFDDALYCYKENDLFSLIVAIADVSYYVKTNSILDLAAYARGISIYLPNQVIPMLPEKLSNNLCSLKPNVDRLVMCCEMLISNKGEISQYKVFNAVINSKQRLTYDKVEEWLNNFSLIPEHLTYNITNLFAIYRALISSRHHRGAIDFNSIEPYFEFDEIGNICDIKTRTRLTSHKVIEEAMLAANVTIADYILKNNCLTLFRNHEKPTLEKFNHLKTYLNSIAVKFDVSYDSLTPNDYVELLNQNKSHLQFTTIEQAILRSMQLAHYSPQNLGHFGLSYDKYLHFTSPIRRYPDLLTHRILKDIIKNNSCNNNFDLNSMGQNCSFTERQAEDIERRVNSFYKCQYAKNHISQEFEGIITSITNFGAFVYMPKLMVDGLIHITELGEDYFIYNESKQILVGKKSGIRFQNGQKIKVQIVSVNLAKLFIDLICVEETINV